MIRFALYCSGNKCFKPLLDARLFDSVFELGIAAKEEGWKTLRPGVHICRECQRKAIRTRAVLKRQKHHNRPLKGRT